MRGVLERLGLALPTVRQGGEAKRVLDQIIEEMVAARREQNAQWEGVKSLKDSPRWLALMDEPAAVQIDVALAALAANKRGMGGGGGWDYWLRRDLPFAAARSWCLRTASGRHSTRRRGACGTQGLCKAGGAGTAPDPGRPEDGHARRGDA